MEAKTGSHPSASIKEDYVNAISGVGIALLKLNGRYARVRLDLSNLQDNVLCDLNLIPCVH